MRAHWVVATLFALGCVMTAPGITLVRGASTASLCDSSESDGAARCATVIDAIATEFPPPPAVLAAARLSLAPGATFADLAVPGPTVLLVERGSLVVDVPGETEEEGELEDIAQMVRRAPVDGTPVPASGMVTIATVGIFRVALRAGDQMEITADWPHHLRNDAAEPAVVLAVAVTPPEPAEGGPAWPPAGAAPATLPTGVSLDSLDVGYRTTVTLPLVPALQVLVERVTLPPQAILPNEGDGVGARLIYLESGSVALEVDEPVDVRTAGGEDRKTSGPVTLSTGDRALLGNGVPFELRNESGATATMLVFSLIALAEVPEGQSERYVH